MSPEEERFLTEIAGMEESAEASRVELSDGEISQIQQMSQIGLGPADICRIINAGRFKVKGKRKKPQITLSSFKQLMQEYAPVRNSFLLGQSLGKAEVNASLLKAAKNGNVTAIKYYHATVSHRNDPIVNAAYIAEQGNAVDTTNVIVYLPDNGRPDSEEV